MSYVSIAVAIAGLAHLWLAPQHYSHAPVHGIFFAVAGIAQVAWALLYNRQPTRQLYQAGLVLTGGLIVLWAITRVVTQPFHGHAGSVDLDGIVVKTAELIGFAGLVIIAASGSIKGVAKGAIASVLATAVLIAVSAGAVTYGIAVAAEQVLPQSSSEHGAEHGGEQHEHEGEEEHEE